MLVYHGSDHIIKVPLYNGSKHTNDYGYGFYTTEDIELAKEWACISEEDGYANCYDVDFDGLSVLNLNSPDYNILNWLAILTRYRSYWQRGSIAEEAKAYLQDHFFINPEDYDVIIGYRADDSYFSFAQDFISGTISLSKLSEAMRLGKLGEQIVFKSKKCFVPNKHIRYIKSELARGELYFEKRKSRDKMARQDYRSAKKQADGINELFMIDIMREGTTNDDPRLR